MDRELPKNIHAVMLGRKGGLANKGIPKPKSVLNLKPGRPKGAKNKPKGVKSSSRRA